MKSQQNQKKVAPEFNRSTSRDVAIFFPLLVVVVMMVVVKEAAQVVVKEAKQEAKMVLEANKV